MVINRFRVPEDQQLEFRARAEEAIAVLAGKPGWQGGELARNVDDPQLWTLLTRWDGVGSYRRGLGGYQAKLVVVPLLSLAIDEPSAYLLTAELDADQLDPTGLGG